MAADFDDETPEISVVAPVFDEVDNVETLCAEIVAALSAAGLRFEIIFVDDASRDGTEDKLRALAAADVRVRPLRHGRNAGQSRALMTGVRAARAPLILTMDGDLQNDPADGVRLIARLQAADADLAMVAGERRDRRDPAAKKWASSLANGLRRRLLNDGARDTGCGLKAVRREAYLALPYFDHMHRFLPALLKRDGYEAAFEPVSHRPRVHGVSKYDNWRRLRASLFDIMGVVWLLARRRPEGEVRPLGGAEALNRRSSKDDPEAP